MTSFTDGICNTDVSPVTSSIFRLRLEGFTRFTSMPVGERSCPDLMEQIRLSLAELEWKKPGPPQNQVRKAPNSVKKKPQRVHA
jgi:hypothetical protein